jgi:hypothetical protein
MNYLELAKQKFSKSKEVDYMLPLNHFIMDCYVRLNPCSYGLRIASKICIDSSLPQVSSRLGLGDCMVGERAYEIKVSFLSQENTYCITHIRMWQKFTHYILCFVDCRDNFTPNFIVLNKFELNKLNLGAMNNTKEANVDNHNIELRVTIKKDSKEYNFLLRNNLLNGTSYGDLREYIEKMNKKL